MTSDELPATCDVAVIGGGAAGLSAGLTLARAGRSVVVVDDGAQRNLPAEGIHGFLTREGLAPDELVRIGTADVRGYGGRVVAGRVARASALTPDAPDTAAFALELEDGRGLRARRVILAAGLRDELPSIPGLRERWGRDVVHCPYCHGHEVRDTAIAVLASGPMAAHALLVRQWSDDVTLFLDGGPAPEPRDAERLAARGIAVVPEPIAAVEVQDDAIVGLRLEDGRVVPRRTVFAVGRMVARADVAEQLGLRVADHPSGMGREVEADGFGQTGIPGVWAAGNVRDVAATVVSALDQGVRAAAHANHDLVQEDAERALAAAVAP
jgi:thioredoxin reductase